MVLRPPHRLASRSSCRIQYDDRERRGDHDWHHRRRRHHGRDTAEGPITGATSITIVGEGLEDTTAVVFSEGGTTSATVPAGNLDVSPTGTSVGLLSPDLSAEQADASSGLLTTQVTLETATGETIGAEAGDTATFGFALPPGHQRGEYQSRPRSGTQQRLAVQVTTGSRSPARTWWVPEGSTADVLLQNGGKTIFTLDVTPGDPNSVGIVDSTTEIEVDAPDFTSCIYTGCSGPNVTYLQSNPVPVGAPGLNLDVVVQINDAAGGHRDRLLQPRR